MISTERGGFCGSWRLTPELRWPDDLEAVAFEAHDLAGRRIAQQHHLAHAEIEQDLRADAVFDQALLAGLLRLLIALEARRRWRRAVSRGSARSRRGPSRPTMSMALCTRVSRWPPAPKMSSSVLRHARGRGPGRPRDIALDQRDMLGGVDRGRIDFKREGAAIDAVDSGLGNDLDQMIVAKAVGDEIGDGGDLEPVGCAKAMRSGSRAMVPSSFIISQITPAG